MNAPDFSRQFKAIVIGASAGGIDAFRTILSAIPRGYELPIVFVLHLPPGGKDSRLPEFAGTYSKIPVKEAWDKEQIGSGTVYIAPSDYHLLINPDFCFSLSSEEPLNYSRPSIDVLFESASDAFGADLLAVLLTGANDDGVKGLKKIQSLGGYVLVQDPTTAFAPTMPEAALKNLRPDRLMTLDKIGAFLSKLKRKTLE